MPTIKLKKGWVWISFCVTFKSILKVTLDHLPNIMKINIKCKTQYEPTGVFHETIVSVTQICIFIPESRVLKRVCMVKVSKDKVANIKYATHYSVVSSFICFDNFCYFLLTSTTCTFSKTQILQRHISPADVANPNVQINSKADSISEWILFCGKTQKIEFAFTYFSRIW